MSALNLVRIPVDRLALMAFAIARHLSDDDLGYALHCALRQRFGEAAPQPFRLEEPPGQPPFLIGYAPDSLALNAAQMLPPTDPALDAVFPDSPQCRAMPKAWQVGARFRFKVRVRPLVRYGGRVRIARAKAGTGLLPSAGEVDAFIAACDKAGAGAVLVREAVYHDWLVRRLAPAAVVEEAGLDRMQRIHSRRSLHGGKGTHMSESYEATFSGTLAIADADAFFRLLARGVGRHAAFGFGMLTLAPPGPFRQV